MRDTHGRPTRLWKIELEKERERIRDRTPPPLIKLVNAPSTAAEASPSGRRRALAYDADENALSNFLALQPAIKPWDHQHSGVCFMSQRINSDGRLGYGGLLCDDMRTGKTVTVWLFILRDLQERLARGATRFAEPYLIVCPKRLTAVWLHELKNVLPGQPLVVREVNTHTVETLQERDRFDVVITTYSSLRVDACVEYLLRTPAYRALFCDEAHELRNKLTIAHNALLRISVRAAWFISGTPVHNHLDNLHAAFRIARVPESAVATDDDRRETMRHVYLRREVGQSLDRLPVTWLDFAMPTEKSCYRSISRSLGEINLDRHNAKELYNINKLRQLCIAPALVLADVTPPDELVWQLPAGASAEESTVHAVATHLLTVKSVGGNVNVVTEEIKQSFYTQMARNAPNAKALAQAWESFCDQVVAYKERMIPPVSTKEAYVARLLTSAESRNEKVIVFSNYCEPLERLVRLCAFRRRDPRQGGLGLSARAAAVVHGRIAESERDAAQQRFVSDPAVGVLLITLQLGYTGHDFSCANHVVLLDPWYNPQMELQAVHRVLGPKQTREVRIHRLALRGTIDATVVGIADKKIELAARHLPAGQRLQSTIQDDVFWDDQSGDASADVGDADRDDPMSGIEPTRPET